MLSLASLLLLPSVDALLPLVVQGNKFYQLQSDYNQPAESFTVFGVDYQPGGSSGFSLTDSSDVLTNVEACTRDAYLLNKLGANAIRVYSVSPWLNHDECMSIFNNAGIYVLLDVNTPDNSINRYDPDSSYHVDYLNNVFGLVDAFKKYPNLMGFIAGNEVINDGKSASVDPTYIRAVIRDVKQYIQQWSNRSIPVGYAAADEIQLRDVTFEYLQCNANTGNSSVDSLSRADFFGINSYTWCSGVNTFETSGYEEIIDVYNSTSIPILFTEYGCNAKLPRSFDEVDGGVYGPLKNIVSGGFVYEYSNEVSNYGLVDIDEDGNASLLQDYDNLQTAFAKVNVTKATATVEAVTPTTLSGVPTCSPTNAAASAQGFGWDFNLPPCPAPYMIQSNGGNNNVGSIISVKSASYNFTIIDAAGSTITPTYTYSTEYGVNYQTNVPSSLLNKPVPGSLSAVLSSSLSNSIMSAEETSYNPALYGKADSDSSATSNSASSSASATGSSSSSESSSSASASTSSKKNSGTKTAVPLVLGAFVAIIVTLM